MPPIQLRPLGDQAMLVYLPDEAVAVRFAAALTTSPPDWLVDVVPAYSTVGVYFDPGRTTLAGVRSVLNELAVPEGWEAVGRRHVIPCCYEMQLDLARVADHCGLTADRVIELHTARDFAIYAIGFCPGFPYLGYLPQELTGVPRLASPRLRVEPGSIGLTGRQTGLYPLARPGGWNLIGRTPLELVNVEDGYFPLQVGDRVRFERIDEAEFRRRAALRLPAVEARREQPPTGRRRRSRVVGH